MPPKILCCYGNVFTELLPTNDRGIHRQTHTLSFHNTWTAKKMMRPVILLLLRIFGAVGTCSLSRCLPAKEEIHFTKPLPGNNKGDTRTDTQTDGRDL
jgi:hypothetical protein